MIAFYYFLSEEGRVEQLCGGGRSSHGEEGVVMGRRE